MALTPDELAAGERLSLYNSRKFDVVTNRLGLGQGGQRNFISAADDLSTFGSAVMREAMFILSEAENLAGLAEIAATIAEGGPVRTVTIGNGEPQTGDVEINLDEISGEVEVQLAVIQAAQAGLAARIASANAYSLAFGG